MTSRLLQGIVWHTRKEPAYRLDYRVFYLEADLAELPRLSQRLRAFSHNRFGILSLRDNDYLALQDRSILEEARRRCGDDAASISLITMPRMLGYAFNPVSFFLVRDSAGRLRHVLAEVHNTWGERHVYALASSSEDGIYRAETAKAFYVSPFLDMEGRYDFALREAADGALAISISERRGEEEAFFYSGLDLRTEALTDGALLRALVRFPFLNLKVIGAIHWHGLKLWLRGEPFRRNPAGQRKHPKTARETQ